MLMFNVCLHLRVKLLFLLFAICHLFSYENWLLVVLQYAFLEKVKINNMKVTIVCLQVWMIISIKSVVFKVFDVQQPQEHYVPLAPNVGIVNSSNGKSITTIAP